ncbi:MAG: family 20 glycosylhydrolase [Chitinophagaceae bacterium]
MKKITALFTCLTFTAILVAQDKLPALIPQPVLLEKREGSFKLTNTTRILVTAKNADAMRVARQLTAQIQTAGGFSPVIAVAEATKVSKPNTILLALNTAKDTELGTEGYKLDVGTTGVTVRANTAAGLFYGVQTLLQLLPAEITAKTVAKKGDWVIPAVHIVDYPRFAWRGMMFDVSRHFFTKADVKKFIDQMVAYKYNLLHLHLTDDQGWRIEIKALPKLTEVGAWRVEKTGTFGTFSAPTDDEPRTYGGFFTQDDIRELIAYAADRFVNIMPEIDVPGHSMAAVATFPNLSCTPGNYRVASGDKFMQWTDTGFYALVDNTLCPANEEVYTFLDKVFTEVAQLFPFQYIHMGGDECAKNFWEKSEAIKQLMQRENLKDMHEVQSYFVKRVAKIVESKGKKLIGWDEILDGGIPPSATVMSWRGIKGGVAAAKAGHDVVMTPSSFVYIDLRQGDPAIEPPVYSIVRLKTAYQFDPVPDGVDAKYIKGGQANLWTEQIYNMRHAEYMTWPRAFAIAESVWSPKEKKNWNDFVHRTEEHFKRFDAAEIKYAPSMYDPAIKAIRGDNDALKVELSTEVDGLDIYYSFDNSYPDRYYPKYTQPVIVPKDAVNMRMITYRDKKVIGRMVTISVADLRSRLPKK